jgi:leucyl aminopeptidase
MTVLPVRVAPPGEAPAGVTAVGVPVLAGADGPELPAGLAAEVAGVDLPAGLDAGGLRRQGFAATVGQALALRPPAGGPVVVLLGLGDAAGAGPERWRRAAAAFVRAAGEGGVAVLAVPAPVVGGEAGAVGAAVAEGAVLAAYRFDPYRSVAKPGPVDEVVLAPGDGADAHALAHGVRRGSTAAGAAVFARDLINTPGGDLPPRRLAERVVERLEGTAGTTVEVWDGERIAAERLGGLLGVSRGSAEPPRLLRATYEPSDPVEVDGHVPHVVLVGKGITFDSGGLSLKTADGMTTMKTDMSGAAVVLAALSACAALDVRARVTALAPVAENMPGGRATKPGDVLTIRNGSTVEVLNTDAEGRLVLADALSLAAEIEPPPDAVVDVATLTGAATVALGTGVAALFGTDEDLVARVRAAGESAGERLWPMPMPEDYAEHIDSDVADMKNVGRPGQAGAIAAAMLLSRFTGDLPWAHLDIAGTGRSAESSGYLSKGGTAFGVRTLLALLASYG